MHIRLFILAFILQEQTEVLRDGGELVKLNLLVDFVDYASILDLIALDKFLIIRGLLHDCLDGYLNLAVNLDFFRVISHVSLHGSHSLPLFCHLIYAKKNTILLKVLLSKMDACYILWLDVPL